MVEFTYSFILVLVIINTATSVQNPIHRRVAELNKLSMEMYGEPTTLNIEKTVDIESFMYPRGDKHKLCELASLWREYYSCTARQLDALTASCQLQSVILMVYQGAVARLTCTACVAPGEAGKLTWMYAKSPETMDFIPLEAHERLVPQHGNLTIYNVMADDAGVYWCQIGASGGGLVVLEVVDDKENYTVVKPPTARGPHSAGPKIYSGIKLFSLWTPWSECSLCGRVGKRRRYGMCYVKLNEQLITNYTNKTIGLESHSEFIDLDDKLIELFEAFPEGIPCRSQYLPPTIRSLDLVQRRPSEIMIGLCKVPCEKTSKSKQATNRTSGRMKSSGIMLYSLTQMLPKQPPLPARNTIFVDFGQRITIRCPGTTLRDVPFRWRIGTKHLVPRNLEEGSDGRVQLNSRDQLVFTTIVYKDANLYSCWQRGNLAGTVKLIVWEGAHARWRQRVLLALTLLGVGAALQAAAGAVTRVRRRRDTPHLHN